MKPEQLRARVIAEWRGLPEIPFFPKDTAKLIAEPLAKLVASLGLGERLREEEVIGAWQEIVGEFVAKHSTPQRLKDKVLHVRVLQPTVLYELDRVWKREITEKLKARFGVRTVREVRFRIG